jgi:hypothetical protein
MVLHQPDYFLECRFGGLPWGENVLDQTVSRRSAGAQKNGTTFLCRLHIISGEVLLQMFGVRRPVVVARDEFVEGAVQTKFILVAKCSRRRNTVNSGKQLFKQEHN